MADKNCEAMNVRFLIDPKTERIVYAEAGKAFVDFLVSLLSMPIGAAPKLLREAKSSTRVGSVSKLYDSIEKLDSQFMGTDKSRLLDSLRIEGRNYYVCSSNTAVTHNFSFNSGDRCICGNPINRLVQLRQNTTGSSSQSEMTTFIITDDLKIAESTTTTGKMLLDQLYIEDSTDLQERNAIVDHIKVLEIVVASLSSNTVLNDVFGSEFSGQAKVSIAG